MRGEILGGGRERVEGGEILEGEERERGGDISGGRKEGERGGYSEGIQWVKSTCKACSPKGREGED